MGKAGILLALDVFGGLYDAYGSPSDEYIYNETTVGTGPGVRTR